MIIIPKMYRLQVVTMIDTGKTGNPFIIENQIVHITCTSFSNKMKYINQINEKLI